MPQFVGDLCERGFKIDQLVRALDKASGQIGQFLQILIRAPIGSVERVPAFLD